MTLTRRSFLQGSLGTLILGKLAEGTASATGQQGVASHRTKAQPRMAPSGRPFNAHFTDVAQQAGLVALTLYGEPDHKDYILETTGRTARHSVVRL
jgi:hypothetical protein